MRIHPISSLSLELDDKHYYHYFRDSNDNDANNVINLRHTEHTQTRIGWQVKRKSGRGERF